MLSSVSGKLKVINNSFLLFFSFYNCVSLLNLSHPPNAANKNNSKEPKVKHFSDN